MSKNKIGFNNFKAFGPKMQYFTTKPITLIYGPNSVGKSSLLHSQLYLESIKNPKKSGEDIFKSVFAGDELDLGGFENYIYKHDINNTIKYETIYTEQKDILEFFFSHGNSVILELANSNFFNSVIDLEVINQKLESLYKDTNIKFKHILNLFALREKFTLEVLYAELKSNYEREDEVFKEKQLEILNNAMIDYFQKDIEKINEEKKIKFIDKIDKLATEIKKAEKEATKLEKAIFLTLHTKPENIASRLQFLNYLTSIKEIKVFIEISHVRNMKILPKITFYIDNDLLMTVEKVDRKHNNTYLNKDNICIKKFEQLTSQYTLYRRTFKKDNFNIYNDINFSLVNFLLKDGRKNKIQYFGPLRPYPQRWEMSLIENADSLKKVKYNDLNIIIKKIFFLYSYIKSKSQKSKFKTFLKPFLHLFGIIIHLSFSISKKYRQFSMQQQKEDHIDSLNDLLPEKFRIWNKNKYQATDAWKTLLYNKDVLLKLNNWLQNKKKLKSSYKVKINKTALTYLEIFWFYINKLLNSEKTYFINHNIRFKDINIDAVDKVFVKPFIFINAVWNTIEGRLNIKQRYKSQIIFEDLSSNTEVTPKDMGLGIAQVMPILISTFNNKNTTIYLEQPELHLHPAVQMEIADEFIKSVKENDNEFMIETHSEHLLLRIMKRMRHTSGNKQDRDKTLDLTPDDVCLLYVDNDNESTYIQELRLSSDGKLLDAWPNGFFEEGFKERFS